MAPVTAAKERQRPIARARLRGAAPRNPHPGLTQGDPVDPAAALVTGLTATIGAIATAVTRLSRVWNGAMPGILSDGGDAEKKP